MQQGALAALDPQGLGEISTLIDYYMENAKMLREAMEDIGLKVHGGTDAPYVFVDLEGSHTRARSRLPSLALPLTSTPRPRPHSIRPQDVLDPSPTPHAGKSSWDMFSKILEEAQVVTIPGAGFGPGGEGFLRLSAFAPREACIEACERLRTAMKP